MINWILATTSVVMYIGAMLIPVYFWWLIFFFLTPLFYLALRFKLTWYHGLWWGILFATLISGGETYSVLLPLPINAVLKIFMGASLMLYTGLHSAPLFGIGQFIVSWRKKYMFFAHPLFICFIWIFIFWLFFIWVSGYSFWIFIRAEGPSYSTNPITALIEFPSLLYGITTLGKYGLLLLLIAWQGALSLVLFLRHKKHLALWITLSIFWLLFTLKKDVPITPGWINRIAYIPRTFNHELSATYAARQVKTYIEALIQHDPAVDIFILPEDGIQSSRFYTHQTLCKTCMPNLNKCYHLIFGAYRKEGIQEFNTLYHLSDCELKHHYDKQYTMIFSEEIPNLIGTSILKKNIMFNPLSRGKESRAPFYIDSAIAFIPYICSEVFFMDQPDDNYPIMPILAACSDKWATWDYTKERCLRVARLKAMEWQRDILFISYTRAGFLTKTGNFLPLKDFTSISAHADLTNKEQEDTRALLCNLDFATYKAIESHKPFHIASLRDEYTFSLLLDNRQPYTGFSYDDLNPFNHAPEHTTIVIKQVQEKTHKILHFYLLPRPHAIYYIDTIKIPTQTKHLSIIITSEGVVEFEDPIDKQTLLISKYR